LKGDLIFIFKKDIIKKVVEIPCGKKRKRKKMKKHKLKKKRKKMRHKKKK